jgi:putative heme-binding domain-containing protein
VGRPQALFDGVSLSGWIGDSSVWSVQEGCIKGSTEGHRIDRNTFLIWAGGEVADFELAFDVRLQGSNNSGVQYRSRRVGEFGLAGYQCDVHPAAGYFGMLYEEKGRGIVAQRGQHVIAPPEGKTRVVEQTPVVEEDLSQWHRFRIVAKGRTVEHYIDGQRAIRFDDETAQAPRQGVLGLQVHSGPPMTVWFRNITLTRLPTEEVALVAAQPRTAPVPQWIWDEQAGNDEELFFRRKFSVTGRPKSASLAISCDNGCRVYLGGERILTSRDWAAVRIVDVTTMVKPGDNVLAVHGWNEGGPAGLCAWLTWVDQDGSRHHVVSDTSWRVAAEDPDGWDASEFDASGWSGATALAALGSGVWGASMPADAFDEVLESDEPRPAQPAPELQLPAGFSAVRLFDVPRSMGSWVVICSAPDGSLYASDQGRGLFRIVPADADDPSAVSTIQRIDVDLPGCQGLCWAFDSLYAVANVGKPGLYRLRDRDGDGVVEDVELLRALPGSGEHGPHAIEPDPDGKHLLVLCGNHVKVTELVRSRVPQNWAEDRLLPRMDDPRGHARGIMAPGGYLCRVDPDGQEWEMICAGFRNAYDLGVQPYTGEIFVYDADMEWDMGTPWYRPTRVLHCVSGADYGWRHGSGKWPAYAADSLPAVADIGPGSPTGVLFPDTPYGGDRRTRLLCADWTFGLVHELDLQRSGASFIGRPQTFAAATPLPVADVCMGHDGRLYLVAGGRGIRSTLYRITSYQPAAEEQALFHDDSEMAALRGLRLTLEEYHGREDDAALSVAWQHLGHEDVFIRHAARIAVESQPVATWRQRASAEKRSTWSRLTALLALCRQGGETDLGGVLDSVADVAWEGATHQQRLAVLRVYELAFVRLGRPDALRQAAVAARLGAVFPGDHEDINRELCALLAFLDDPGLLDAAVPLLAELRPSSAPEWAVVASRNDRYGQSITAMLEAMPPIGQLGIADALRTVHRGWTLEQRRDWFSFLAAARTRKGGASYDGYLKRMIDLSWEGCAEAERAHLAELVGKAREEPAPFVARQPEGPGRAWQLDEAVAYSRTGLVGRDFEAGRNHFHAVGCASCHRFAGEGGAHGPDLTSLGGKFSARDVLEAIIDPSKVVSDQYAGAVLQRQDGSNLFGRVVRTQEASFDGYVVVPASAHAEEVRVEAKDVVKIEPSAISPMPAALIDRLNPQEMLDLLAFLLSRGDREAGMFGR